MCMCSQQLAWMADFVESPDHHLQTILHNFSAAQHGKGPADFEAGACIYVYIYIYIYIHNILHTYYFFFFFRILKLCKVKQKLKLLLRLHMGFNLTMRSSSMLSYKNIILKFPANSMNAYMRF